MCELIITIVLFGGFLFAGAAVVRHQNDGVLAENFMHEWRMAPPEEKGAVEEKYRRISERRGR